MTTVLVIGCGNRQRGDDAAGPLALDHLRHRAWAGIALRECQSDPVVMLEWWSKRDCVVVLDAVRSGRPPGEVVVLSPEQLDPDQGIRCVSTHGLGLLEVIRLGATLSRLPPELWIVGIEGKRFEPGAKPSAAVRQGARKAAHLVARRWGSAPCTS